MQDNVITAQNLSGGYKNTRIWSDATFTLRKGEFITVLGPNGSGKTTLFRLLLGLISPIEGSLTILGKTPQRGDQRIGYVPQRHDIDRDTAIEAREFIKLGLVGTRWGIGFNSNGNKEADEALVLVQATELAHKPLGKMSGGELQRIFLAQALVSNPDILLLDEPLANLDIRRESNLVNLISSVVKNRNVTVLLIAHNINPLLPVTDRVLYIANSTMTLGTPEEVLTSDTLSKLYGITIEVLRDSKGRLAIIGIEESGAHNHEHDTSHE
jgi:zinc/manganese transport system ATP-binding protein